MRKFYLWTFTDGKRMLFTRGETQDQALSYAAHSPSFPRGVTIYPMNYSVIDAAKLYASNHAEGWLYRKPRWLQKAEMQEAAKKGVKGVIEDIANGVKHEPLLYQP